MIDQIIRRSYNEYVIVYLNRSAVTVISSGNAWALVEWMLYDRNYMH